MADRTKFDDAVPPMGGDPSDLDPFAELKRIMGLDVNEPAKSAGAPAPVVSEADFIGSLSVADKPAHVSQHANTQVTQQIEAAHRPTEELADDFGIDLERELMGEFLVTEPADKAPAFSADDEFDAAFAENAESLEAAFKDQPQSQAELDADLEDLNVVFADAEPAVSTAAVAEQKSADAAADDFAIALDESDFADIDQAIALEMDEALSAGLDALKPEAKAQADVDTDFGFELDWSSLDAPKTETKQRSAPVETDTDSLLAALDEAAKRITNESGASDIRSDASNENPVAALGKMSDQFESRGNQYDWRQPVRNAQPRAAAPEVETTEMFDQAFSMTDDLDLPEVRYDEPAQASSDIDLEFDNLLNEMSRPEPARPVRAAAAPIPEAPRYEPRQPSQRAEDFDFDSVFAQPAPRAPAAPKPYQAQEDNDLGDFDFDEGDFDDEEPAQQAYRPNDRGGRGGRGMMIAAIVGGVALLGGIGAMAMSWNGESGAPAMVKADTSPIKVRPENPGGVSVPNQDSAVYDTVSRSGGQQPTQERLVSATEDPIAIPLPDDTEGEEVASVKDEDRVAPTEADASATQDPLAVAPRKVRTMIVKPDGTLAPAAEPAAAAPAEPSVEDIAAAPEGETEQVTTGAIQPAPAAEPEAETVAAVAPPAPSGWAVQIASQPNEDGANKSMKSMSQKYSGVIGERGLHIVKAEVPNKGTYWRVRVAAASRDDAVSVCSNIKSTGGSCFVTR